MASDALSSIPTAQLDNFLNRLENRPKPALCHEFGGGSRCTRCDCPGLDLHFWRKICKICCCRLDEHDILLPDDQDPGALITRKLFSQVNHHRFPPTESIIIGSIEGIRIGSDQFSSSSSSSSTISSTKMDNIGGGQWAHSKAPLAEKIGRLKLGEDGKENGNGKGKRANGNGNGNDGGREDGRASSGIGIKLLDQIPRPDSPPPSPPPPPPPPIPPFPLPKTTKTNPVVDFHAPTHVIYENIKNAKNAKSDGNNQSMAFKGGLGQNREDWVWTPSGDWPLARRYLLALEEADWPLKGREEGQRRRRQRLAQQLPQHDSDVGEGGLKGNNGEERREQKMHREFIELVKREIVGIAEIVDYAEHKAHFAAKMDPNCRQCSEKFDADAVGIVTDHEGDKVEAIWHPRCFVCSVCHQLLVDLLYFHRDGKYYCGRHFGEKLYPRCAGCDELIFALEYTFAEEKSWHLEHFCCFGCDAHLCGNRYVVKEDQPFCVQCYMHKFARTCLTCCQKIAPFDQRVTYGEMHWHAGAECFKCQCCSKPLSNQQFLLQNEQPFCSAECKQRHFGVEKNGGKFD